MKINIMLLIRSIVMSVALIAICFTIYQLKTNGISGTYFYLDSNAKPSFDKNQVTHLEWKAKNKVYVLDTDSDKNFFPPETNAKAKELVQFLSQIQLNDIEQRGAPALDVVVTVNGESWNGTWDGMSFQWKTGPHKGKGEVLKQEKNIVFFKGKHIFETININLCEKRISKIQIDAHGKSFTIEQVGRGWSVVSPVSKPLDPIFIEKWLIGLCKVRSETVLDLDYAQGDKLNGYIAFEFIDKKRLPFQQIEKDFYILNGEGVLMSGLSKLHEELKGAIENAGTP